MNTEPTQHLVSIGRTCQTYGVSYSRVMADLEAHEVQPVFTLDGIGYYREVDVMTLSEVFTAHKKRVAAKATTTELNDDA